MSSAVSILAVLIVGAFLLGAIPFGFVAARLRGVDLRQVGSGNIGATNVLRTLGWKVALPVFLLDALKGWLPVFCARSVLAEPAWWVVAAGMAAVLGHIYSPFVRFRGGKGVATSLGALAGFSPIIAGITLAAFIVVVALTRYVSLGSLIGAALQAILFWAFPPAPQGDNLPYRLFGVAVAIFVFVRHRSNIVRLLRGEENRFSFARKKPEV